MTEDLTRYFVKEKVTAGNAKEEYTHYYDACPEGHYFHDKGGYECKGSCEDKPYEPVSETENVCVDKCVDSGYDFREGDICQDKCNGDRPHKTVSGENICVESCTEENFDFRNGDECRSDCPSGFYEVGGNDIKVCI